jgi:hypothetical protein
MTFSRVASAGLLVLAGLLLIPPSAALAACAPGNANNNIILCDAVDDANGANIPGRAGDDTITLNGGSAGTVTGGSGADAITLNGGTAVSVGGDGDDDTITLNGAAISGEITGDGGDDTIDLNSGSAASVSGDENDDHITLEGDAVISGAIAGNNGEDTIDLISGQAGSVTGGGDVDTITLGGATIDGKIDGGSLGDTINLNSGTADSVTGNDGVDKITLDGATIAGAIEGESGDDTIVLKSGKAGSVSGGSEADQITLEGTAEITGAISSGDGDDTIDLKSGSAGSVNGGNSSDTINLDGATIIGIIDGGSWSDEINLNSGSAASVTGEDGFDTITLDGATIPGAIEGDNGQDTIVLKSGRAGSVSGGNEVDTITLSGATVDGAISGGNLDDTINLYSGSAATVTGDSGDDIITLDGTAIISGAIDGGGNADIIKLLAGQAGSVDAGTGNDTITLDGATIDGAVEGNVGDDVINLLSGSAASIDAGAGSDTIDIDSATFDLDGVLLSGGSDVDLPDMSVDTLNFNDEWSGSLTGASITAFETINLNGGTVRFVDALLEVGGGDGQGLFVNSGGTLDATAGLELTGNLGLDAGTTLGMGGSTNLVSVSGDLGSAGLIDMSGTMGLTGDRLAVGGDYVATGAAALYQDLDLLTGTADLLEVDGATSGTTQLAFNIVGSGGVADDIVVVRAGGAANGVFETGDLSTGSGLARYALLQNDAGDWVVRSQLDADLAGATIGSYADLLAAMAFMPGSTRPAASGFVEGCSVMPAGEIGAAAAHITSSGTATGPAQTIGYGGSSDATVASFGVGTQCGARGLGADGDFDLLLGATVGLIDASTRSGREDGQLNLQGLSVSVEAVLRHDALTLGVRLDQARYSAVAISDAVFGADGSQGFSGSGSALSVSAAYAMEVGSGVVVTPGLALDYTRADFDSFATTAGVVTIDRIEQLTASAEVRTDWRMHDTLTLHGAIGLDAPLTSGTVTTLAAGSGDIDLVTDGPGTLGHINVGIDFSDAAGLASGFAEMRGWFGAESSGLGVQAGYRVALP